MSIVLNTTSYFDKVSHLSSMLLNNSIVRGEAISDNIANVDTPHYKKKEISFESELTRVLNQKEIQKLSLYTTHPLHISFGEMKNYREVKSRITEEYDTNYRNDKNNVDIEKEVGDLTKNYLHFNAIVSSINQRFTRIKSVIV